MKPLRDVSHPHIVATVNGQFLCEACGRVDVVPFPVAVDAFCSLSEKFIATHRSCKEGDHVQDHS